MAAALEAPLALAQTPEVLLQPSAESADELTTSLRALYAHGRALEGEGVLSNAVAKHRGPLPELFTEGFESEQIWEELELQNKPLLRFLRKKVKALVAAPEGEVSLLPAPKKERVRGRKAPAAAAAPAGPLGEDDEDDAPLGEDDEDDELGYNELESGDEGEEGEGEEGDEDEEGGEEGEGGDKELFSLDDMNAFADEGEMEQDEDEDDDEEDVDLFAELEDGDDGDEAEIEPAPKSKGSKKEQKRREQIEALEEAAIGEKPWALKGEVSAQKRPANSLLEATLEFEHTTRPAPVVTIEATATLEDVIKMRVLEKRWDDPVRKLPPAERAARELAEVSTEKSKLGLGDLLEADFMRTTHGVDSASDKRAAQQKEVVALFRNLTSKLDALSNFFYTPKPAVHEAETAAAVPAIAMEEALPMGVSEAQAQLPEEVFAKKRGRQGVLKGETELDSSDRKRRRREAKKRAAKAAAAEGSRGAGSGGKASRKELANALNARNVQAGVASGDGSFAKSAAFFQHMQDELDSGGAKKAKAHKRKNVPMDQGQAARLKL